MTLPNTIVAPLARALAARGYENLTPVQSAVLTDDADGADLLVSAQTGSGKTVAFGMAIAPTLLENSETFAPARSPLALVIAPTRELALQVQRELEWLYAETGARMATCVGGMDMRTERRALSQGAHIVVGTPGRLRDHITKGSLDMSELRAVVLDEADEMLDLGFREDLEFILAEAPEERRTLLFSATVPKSIAQLAKTYQNDAFRITATSDTKQHADIDYKLLTVPSNERENAIINTLLYFDNVNTIVFCSTREAVKHLSARLLNRGFQVVALSGELSQAERTNALQSMRDGRARICVATDVAARGIDLPNLDLVIHADLPTNADTLLHRSGRTGRAGRKGTCILIVPGHRKASASRLLKTAKLDATYMQAPTSEQIEARYREAILTDELLTAEQSEEEAAFVVELLARHSPEQIAGAYLRQQLAARPAPEDISDSPIPERGMAGDPREKTRFEGGVWFKVSLGRNQRAEPRWLLPMICKAGNVTKTAVGSIRILDNETQFEISTNMADDFAASIKHGGSLEKGITISAVQGAPGERAPNRRPREEGGPRPEFARPDFTRPDSERPKSRTRPPYDPSVIANEFGLQERPAQERPAYSKPREFDAPRKPKSDFKPSGDHKAKDFKPKDAKAKVYKPKDHKAKRAPQN